MLKSEEDCVRIAQEFNCPINIVESLFAYVQDRRPMGDFLRACLENDFKEACARADFTNKNYLPEIASVIYNCIPAISQGSPKRVNNWLAGNPSPEL